METINYFREQASKLTALKASYKNSTDPFEQITYNEIGRELNHYAKAIAALEFLQEKNLDK